MTTPEFAELGFYGLAGHCATPRDLIDEVCAGQAQGLGSVFLSERFNAKDAAVLSGAATAVSTQIGVATAATNHNTRHPLVAATMAVTAHRISGGRFALGLGRGFDGLFDVMNLPRITSAQLTDVVDIYRRLWRGEAVVDHAGPAGRFPYLQLDSTFDETIPVILVALGDATLRLAGRIADGVVLHTYFTDDTVARAVRIVRESAEAAGRDPASIRVWSVLATVGDWVDDTVRLRKTVARLATYLQGYGDLLIGTNGWDPADLAAFRSSSVVAQARGAFDAVATVDEMHRLAEVIPPAWLAASASGSAAHCARRIHDQFDAGATA